MNHSYHSTERFTRNALLLLFPALISASMLHAGDWPMWRFDANRSAASPHALPENLSLHWSRRYKAVEPAWEDPINQGRMPFDRGYEPVVVGTTMVVNFNWSDKVVALDTETGRELWRAYTGGPVRLPPVIWKDNVYVASDDGHLWCLDRTTGAVKWKFRGAPGKRKALGNSRLISARPVRGGPVVKDGTVYFAASIWPFMGIFVHALDAETGDVKWTNSGLGSLYIDQPHAGSVSFAGIAPQGALAVSGDKLLVPNGRAVPACLDRTTGKLLYFHLAGSGNHEVPGGQDRKREGGSHVSAIGTYYFNHRQINTTMYNINTGHGYHMFTATTYPVLTEECFYLSGNPVTAHRFPQKKLKTVKDKNKKEKKFPYWVIEKMWECKVDGSSAMIKAGNELFAAGGGSIHRISLPGTGTEDGKQHPPKVTWSTQVEGTPIRLLAADDKLFAVTAEGSIHAFGAGKKGAVRHPRSAETDEISPDILLSTKKLLETAPVQKGCCIVYNVENGDLVHSIAEHSDFQVFGVSAHPQVTARLRRRFDAQNFYGEPISLFTGTVPTFQPPPYIAVRIFFETPPLEASYASEDFVNKIFSALRPYGGAACFPVRSKPMAERIKRWLREAHLPGSTVTLQDRFVLLSREGPPPGSADWTHQYGDISNSTFSRDRLVKLPLGLLWFGGISHHTVLPRHAHGPPEQVIGGRLIIEGINMLSARDVYTGKQLWLRKFYDLHTFGIYYDGSYKPNPFDTSYNQLHIPGANSRGTNYVATEKKVYLLNGHQCMVLDITNGKTLDTFELAADNQSEKPPTWGYIGVYKELLIGSYSQESISSNPWHSKVLFAMNRHSGAMLWKKEAAQAFRHNALCAGADKLFCIDALPDSILKALQRRGKTAKTKPVIQALNIYTGDTLWSHEAEQIFGTWLGYQKEQDLLLEAGRASRDMIGGEPTKKMKAYRGATGTLVWENEMEYGGPCMLSSDTIYTNAVSDTGTAVDLFSGKPMMRFHALTGTPSQWDYKRFYGCNYVVGSSHLLTFRSGAAGFYDIERDGGTGNFGGFKSGCTSNLVAANGVLNAPDYTRTCTCSYQNQTSLAFVHDPDTEWWTFNNYKWDKKRVLRAGINFGAPGDRRTDSGTLWLDFPSKGGPSPDLPLQAAPKTATWHRMHSSYIKSGPLPWVASSYCKGASKITIQLNEEETPAAPYTVKLIFCEPEPIKAGQRIFNVTLQGNIILRDFDILKETSGPLRTIIKTAGTVSVGKTLTLELSPAEGSLPPVLSGIELINLTP